MVTKHFLCGQVAPKPTIIEWDLRLEHDTPTLWGRNPGGQWCAVLRINIDGTLDPTYGPGLQGLQYNKNGHIMPVDLYVAASQ